MVRTLKENAFFLIITSIAFALIFYSIYKSSITSASFDIDEADYMYALEKGFIAHYFDKNTISFLSFIKLGFSKGLKIDKQTELSKTIRSADDINMYRRFHGPLYFYYMMIGEKCAGNDEHAIRAFSLLLQYICSIVALVGCLFLLGKQHGRFPALTTSFFVLVSPTIYWTTSLVSPHGMYAVWCLLSLFLMVKAVDTKKETYFYLSTGAVAFAFLSLEYAFLLLFCWLISVVVVFLKDKNEVLILWKFLVKSLLIWMMVVITFWPASILKLTLIKNYILYIYLSTIRGYEYTAQSIGAFWWNNISVSPVEYGLTAIGIIAAIYLVLKKKKTPFIPLLAYLFLFFLTTLRNRAPVPTYNSSLVAVGLVTAGLALSAILESKKWLHVGIVSLLCALSFVYLRFYYLPKQQSPRLAIRSAMTTFLKTEMPKKILAPRPELSMLHYYFRTMSVDSYPDEMYLKNEEIAEVKEYLTTTTDYNGMIYAGNFLEEIKAIVSEKYQNNQVVFSRPDWPEQWVYFRLYPKPKECAH
jgi:hypothetical protein